MPNTYIVTFPTSLKYNANYKTSLEGKEASNSNGGNDCSRDLAGGGTVGNVGGVGLRRVGVEGFGLGSIELNGVAGLGWWGGDFRLI